MNGRRTLSRLLRRAMWLQCGVLAACARSAEVPGDLRPTPFPATAPEPALPQIAAVDGALRITVVYPVEDAQITARDSNFIFGATGSGQATLTINDRSVPVAANGAYLAFLPVPIDGVYRLTATKAGETATLERRVRLPPAPGPPDGAVIDTASVFPAGAVALPFGEVIEVGFTGVAGGQANLITPSGTRIALHPQPLLLRGSVDAANFRPGTAAGALQPGIARYAAAVPVHEVWAPLDTTSLPRPSLVALSPDVAGVLGYGWAQLELVVGADTARIPLNAWVAPFDANPPRAAVVTPPPDAPADWTSRGRPSTAGPYHWFWPPGTRLAIDAERAGQFRVRLGSNLAAWIPTADVQLMAPGAPIPRAAVTGLRFASRSDRVDVHIAMATPLPFRVDAAGSAIDITVYGATSEVNFLQYGSLDPLVRSAAWSQPAQDVFALHIELAAPVWGYQARLDEGGALVVGLRRPPHIADIDSPLRGLLIAVDPGHPPAGSTGPTGLNEAEANLQIALQLKPLLESAGARVLLTRADAYPVELGARPRVATELNADLLVSLHNNAFPDGVNPWENSGSSVYYYQPHSLDLARLVLSELLAELRLRDIGIGRADLAVVRATWMPAILSETMFLMVPQQEAALRDAAVQRRIAEAHLRALEQFVRARALAAGR
jgi:N-acetylmuramoyl-L-alanine amidase